jgi:hypothetical protein
MLESFAQLATAAKSLESFENAFQPKNSKVHNGIALRQPQQATLPTEGEAVLSWVFPHSHYTCYNRVNARWWK